MPTHVVGMRIPKIPQHAHGKRGHPPAIMICRNHYLLHNEARIPTAIRPMDQKASGLLLATAQEMLA